MSFLKNLSGRKTNDESSLKKIYGAPDSQRDKQVEADLEKIKKGEVNKVYPVLKPGDWVGLKYGMMHKYLLSDGAGEPLVVIAFGYDTPDNIVFLSDEDLDEHESKDKIKEAYANLNSLPAKFAISELSGGKILTASGEAFSSEKILCRDFMNEAHRILATDRLMVSIPRRTCMMVTSFDGDKPLLSKFLALHRDAWADDSYGNAPITDLIFVLIDGVIDGTLPVRR